MAATEDRAEAGTENVSVAHRVLAWLQVGYPEGIPRQDRFPLVALLGRRLTESQTREVVAELTAPGPWPSRGDEPIDQSEIERLIRRQLSEAPPAADVSRVSARLAAGGWPLADPSGDDRT